MVEIETRCIIPIRQTFGRIQWYVILEPPATLQGAATWRIQCRDCRATCHIAGCCHQANSTACHPRAMYHIAGCCHLVNSLSWFQSYMPHCRVQSAGEIKVMIVPHCRVLPLGEFTVMIPELHATLQGAVSWRNQSHDRATLQGVRIPSAILNIFFVIFYFFLFLIQFRLWRAAAFVSSPIHLFYTVPLQRL